jgi:fructose-bisphosphate aldolase class I
MNSTLHNTLAHLLQPGKGILAADESMPTITKRFAALGIESTEQSRRDYRELLLGAPGVGAHLSGVILFEETLAQKNAAGVPLPELALAASVLPGIKVDKGTIALPNAEGDTITQGLDGLAARLEGYAKQGARFAKWREVYTITERNPTALGIHANAEVLARYAAICQQQDFVPIVEPEVLMDGAHTLARCAEVTQAVLSAVFAALVRHGVELEAIVLKPNMVLPGKANAEQASPELIATETVRVLKRTVPAAVPGINFLSGGQSPVAATANLNAMNVLFPHAPWRLSFSYSRALQGPVMEAWRGKAANREAAQRVFLQRCRLAAAAACGAYTPEAEAA